MMVKCGSIAVTQLKPWLKGGPPVVLTVIVNTVVSMVDENCLQILFPAAMTTVGLDPTSRESVALVSLFRVRVALPGPVLVPPHASCAITARAEIERTAFIIATGGRTVSPHCRVAPCSQSRPRGAG